MGRNPRKLEFEHTFYYYHTNRTCCTPHWHATLIWTTILRRRIRLLLHVDVVSQVVLLASSLHLLSLTNIVSEPKIWARLVLRGGAQLFRLRSVWLTMVFVAKWTIMRRILSESTVITLAIGHLADPLTLASHVHISIYYILLHPVSLVSVKTDPRFCQTPVGETKTPSADNWCLLDWVFLVELRVPRSVCHWEIYVVRSVWYFGFPFHSIICSSWKKPQKYTWPMCIDLYNLFEEKVVSHSKIAKMSFPLP